MADGPFAWPDVLETLLAGSDLDEQVAADVLGTIMDGGAEPAQVAAFLTALRAKGESAGELAGLVRAMLRHAAPIRVDAPLLDTCGTGGDRAGTFNISTVTALVAAAAGARVAKHGNRAASSRCGSADLLEAWGLEIELAPEQVARTIDELGIGFLYARTFHPAMKHVAPVRGALGVRTVFNVLGPLSNPADAQHQVVGVGDGELAPVVAGALARLGKAHALVFHGHGGLDELTTSGPTRIWEVRDGQVGEFDVDPSALDLEPAEPAALRGGDIADNVRIADAVLGAQPGPTSEVVVLNAAAALYAADVVDDLGAGVERARAVLASGAAGDLRDRWIARTRELVTG